jgi:hypothetical protein
MSASARAYLSFLLVGMLFIACQSRPAGMAPERPSPSPDLADRSYRAPPQAPAATAADGRLRAITRLR